MKCNPWVGGSIGRRGFPMLGTGKRGLSTFIKDIFRNGEQGFFYDPNDLSTMFQDAAGTISVTAVGQPVGLIRDKSGRNNHAFQTVSASRPILQRNATTGAYYLAFDGADDFLQTNSINFTATDKVSLFAGVRKLSDASAAMVIEFSNSIVSNSGSFTMYAPGASPATFGIGVKKLSTVEYALLLNGEYKAPISTVITGFATSADISLKLDSKLKVRTISGYMQGNYGNHPIYIGRRGGTTLPFSGHIYGLIGIGKLVSDDETVVIEKELAKRTGATLNV